MFQKILGIIGILWGTGIWISFLTRMPQMQTNLYSAGFVFGLILATLMIVFGIRAVNRKS